MFLLFLNCVFLNTTASMVAQCLNNLSCISEIVIISEDLHFTDLLHDECDHFDCNAV
jgi:hypothetical protein